MKPHAAILLTVLALLSAACQKPDIHSGEAVRDATTQYVKAIKDGDAAAFRDIHSAAQRPAFDADFVKQGFPPRKDFDFKIEGVLLRQQSAGVFGRHIDNGKPGENGQWKLDRQLGSNSPIHRPAFVPPEGGRFIAAGQPWKDVPAQDMSALAAGDFAYELQAVRDESFLHLRLAFKNPLPLPDSPLLDDPALMSAQLPDISPRALRITAPGAAGYFEVVFDTTTITHFRNGRNSFALGYSVALHGPDNKTIFYANAGAEEQLFAVGAHEIIARIPLESLGAGADTAYTVGVTQTDNKVELSAARF